MSNTSPSFNVALISMPWSIFNRPSVQLGALKAFLEIEQGIRVDTFHPYLGAAKNIGTDTYLYLCKNSWAGEALYSSILFPQRLESAREVFKKSCTDNKNIARQFEDLRNILHDHLKDWILQTELKDYQLIGLSVCFSQLFSSLAAAQLIKEHTPLSKIVLGGSSCVDRIGKSLLQRFSQIDYVIDGEGELATRALCHFLQGTSKKLPKQIRTRDEIPRQETLHIKDINDLPVPDYGSYFGEVDKHFPGHPFIPTIPIEFSRGCWWKKCSFCNLNLQWQGYRSKSGAKMLSEIHWLLEKHLCLDFTFCDNALPQREADIFFEELKDAQQDFRFFAEIRVIKDPDKLALYRRGGLTSVQVGIESLSNSLLEKMHKGTTVIENLAAMKHCAECDIKLEGNLITEFPGATQKEAEETLAHLDYALPFSPLSSATFFLGFGSPVASQPHKFGIRSINHHQNNVHLFPEETLEGMELLINDFRGDRTKQKKLWRPVVEKISQWKKFHDLRENKKVSPLSCRDGGSFIILRQERLNGKPLLHRLKGMSRQLYLYCDTIHTLAEIRQQFPTLPEKTLLNFFDDLSKKHLLFRENDSFLALAVRRKRYHNS